MATSKTIAATIEAERDADDDQYRVKVSVARHSP
jgi:hypothetical protein